MSTAMRETLGNFSSVVCLKSIIVGIEDALGEKATAISLIAAGRARGKKLAAELGLSQAAVPLSEATQRLAQALGPDGTRLLVLEKIEQEGDVIKAYTRETVCSTGEPLGSTRKCTFTLGAVWGALEALTGKRLKGKHTVSVLQGGSHDVFEFTQLG
ncbi:hydrocarbon-binding protein [Pseudanabaena sp. FACHB-2040]|uniref:hydrocarbon-binding protein n=1 Tax=Pseudanabaena sp. FACHB-2040 TaxID=2692859 RepID=UPI0016894212|nr:hydrocarbon-binding protein [Pseudanabaena sp. FACHB-2040]MBD2258378.1 hydrocarbon-binding protein [Pseudanabaena sp. FACHB-2040]